MAGERLWKVPLDGDAVVKKWLWGLAAVVLTLACSKMIQPPTLPDPEPTPSPSPPSTLGLLSVSGSDFVANGQRVFLLGSIVCCGDGTKERGWPLVNKQRQPYLLKVWSALVEMAEHGANFTHIRTGPHTAELEGEAFIAYEADGTLRQSYFDRVEDVVDLALSLGIYVEVDLVDGWGLKTGNSYWSAQGDTCAIFAGPLDEKREAWVRKIVQTVGAYPNVLWQDGNEIGVRPCGNNLSYEWVEDLERVVRDEERQGGFSRHVFGTNSERPDIENAAFVDYIERHQREAPYPTSKPIMVNEYGGGVSPDDWLREASWGKSVGVSFHQWRESWTESEIQRALDMLATLRAD